MKDQCAEIKRIRAHYGVPDDDIYADPSIFRRVRASASTVGKSTPDMFWDYGKIRFRRRGNNDVPETAFSKVQSYLNIQKATRNPFNGDTFSPMLFVSDALPFIADEATAYMWKRDPNGVPLDEPTDKDDHSLDTIKYMLSDAPDVGSILDEQTRVPSYMTWRESEHVETRKDVRHG